MLIAPLDRVRRLEAAVAELELLEVSAPVITALKEELGELRIAAEVATTDQSVAAAPLDNALTLAELREAKEDVRRSKSMSDEKRMAVLRALQIKWHPDRQYGDDASKEMAEELSPIVNEAIRIARANIKARQERSDFLTRAYRGAPGVLDNAKGYAMKNKGPLGF